METPETQRIERLLELLEEQRLIIRRMELSCLQLEKELRIRINPLIEFSK